jgi:O-methyltransferase
VNRYLELLKACLTRSAFDVLDDNGRESRRLGLDWPPTAETMIGHVRLDNLEALAGIIFEDGIPGDFLESGVWRGGACIFMRALIDADPTRRVWVCDSFEGLPHPDPKYPADAGDEHYKQNALSVSLEEVQANFRRYGLLDDRVKFLKGWFKDTLPGPIEVLALLRLDGDMYGSTIEVFEALYDRVSPGGFIVVDDYSLRGAREATEDFRRRRAITVPITHIDSTGAFWRKESP